MKMRRAVKESSSLQHVTLRDKKKRQFSLSNINFRFRAAEEREKGTDITRNMQTTFVES